MTDSVMLSPWDTAIVAQRFITGLFSVALLATALDDTNLRKTGRKIPGVAWRIVAIQGRRNGTTQNGQSPGPCPKNRGPPGYRLALRSLVARNT